MQARGNLMDAVCFHCNRCIAKNPPKLPNSCGISCDECECDVCISAKQMRF